mmetsp:Transcript_13314/g.28776  ORF Transcript_13314/g.28776 Transcript_13314/m.28776 type:complete len:135 (+) Transcript_13314:227-631(+)
MDGKDKDDVLLLQAGAQRVALSSASSVSVEDKEFFPKTLLFPLEKALEVRHELLTPKVSVMGHTNAVSLTKSSPKAKEPSLHSPSGDGEGNNDVLLLQEGVLIHAVLLSDSSFREKGNEFFGLAPERALESTHG